MMSHLCSSGPTERRNATYTSSFPKNATIANRRFAAASESFSARLANPISAHMLPVALAAAGMKIERLYGCWSTASRTCGATPKKSPRIAFARSTPTPWYISMSPIP